jgi:hypothetical protein
LLEFAPAQPLEEAGVIVTGASSATLALARKDSGNQIVMRINSREVFARDNAPAALKLRVTVTDGGLCRFSFATADGSVTISQTFAAVKGVWIGARVGLYSIKRLKDERAGHVDCDYFRFQ